IWYTVLIAFPTIWFSVIVPYFGESLHITNNLGKLNRAGFIISIVLCVTDAGMVLLNNWYSSKSEYGKLEVLQGEIEYLRTISENIDRICDEKYERLKASIYDEKEQLTEKAKIITNPGNQLKRIITGITDCLVKLMDTQEVNYQFKDFSVTLAYNFPQENTEWEWAEGLNDRGTSSTELFKPECKSTFNHLLKQKAPYYFNNKKEDAKEKDCYVYNSQDKLNSDMNEPVGSIFCYNFKVEKGKKVYVNAILSISTHKKRFSTSDDEEKCKNVMENMVALVKDSFGKRIKIELSLLYLEYLQCISKKQD
ncbi:MAG: hypothetical protein IJ390_11960, partial [Lachnospiraceae bacterium]|nr:hypothetical protein [Lachnospiraceae bacterium]